MTWFRETCILFRRWWQVEKDYRAAMRALKTRMKDLDRG